MADSLPTAASREAVEDEYLTLAEALALARRLLHDNAASFFARLPP